MQWIVLYSSFIGNCRSLNETAPANLIEKKTTLEDIDNVQFVFSLPRFNPHTQSTVAQCFGTLLQRNLLHSLASQALLPVHRLRSIQASSSLCPPLPPFHRHTAPLILQSSQTFMVTPCMCRHLERPVQDILSLNVATCTEMCASDIPLKFNLDLKYIPLLYMQLNTHT